MFKKIRYLVKRGYTITFKPDDFTGHMRINMSKEGFYAEHQVNVILPDHSLVFPEDMTLHEIDRLKRLIDKAIETEAKDENNNISSENQT